MRLATVKPRLGAREDRLTCAGVGEVVAILLAVEARDLGLFDRVGVLVALAVVLGQVAEGVGVAIPRGSNIERRLGSTGLGALLLEGKGYLSSIVGMLGVAILPRLGAGDAGGSANHVHEVVARAGVRPAGGYNLLSRVSNGVAAGSLAGEAIGRPCAGLCVRRDGLLNLGAIAARELDRDGLGVISALRILRIHPGLGATDTRGHLVLGVVVGKRDSHGLARGGKRCIAANRRVGSGVGVTLDLDGVLTRLGNRIGAQRHVLNRKGTAGRDLQAGVGVNELAGGVEELVALLDGDGELGAAGRRRGTFGRDCLGHLDGACLFLLFLRIGIGHVDVLGPAGRNRCGRGPVGHLERVARNRSSVFKLDYFQRMSHWKLLKLDAIRSCNRYLNSIRRRDDRIIVLSSNRLFRILEVIDVIIPLLFTHVELVRLVLCCVRSVAIKLLINLQRAN